MPVLDIIVLIPLIWFTVKGFMKGFIIELASLAALILGIYIAYFFSDITANFLQNTVGLSSKYLQIISFVLTFVIVIILIFILARFLETLIKTASLSIFNKLLGAVFGFIKISIICGFLLYQLSCLDVNNKIISLETQKNSYIYSPLVRLAVGVIPLMKNIKEKITTTINKSNPSS